MSHKIIGLDLTNGVTELPLVINGIYTRVCPTDHRTETYLLAKSPTDSSRQYAFLSLTQSGAHWNGMLDVTAVKRTLAGGGWTFVGELNIPSK